MLLLLRIETELDGVSQVWFMWDETRRLLIWHGLCKLHSAAPSVLVSLSTFAVRRACVGGCAQKMLRVSSFEAIAIERHAGTS